MLDAEELKYLDGLVDNYEKEYLDSIKDDIIKLFRDAIQKILYDYYDPVIYERQYRLLDNVKIDLKEDNSLFVYTDVLNVGYKSAVTGNNVGDMLDIFVFEGHDDEIGEKKQGMNQYHRYEKREVLETAKEMIQEKYPDLKVYIVNSKSKMEI